MKSLIVLFSFHHNNTEKIAKIIAEVLDAEIKKPQQINPEDFQDYHLIGFGSGIYGGKHHKALLSLAAKLQQVTDKKSFIFSTSGTSWERDTNHNSLREILESKGYTVIDEFTCLGFNTNSFLKYIGGRNKGRPNAEDLKQAKEFALGLHKKLN